MQKSGIKGKLVGYPLYYSPSIELSENTASNIV